MPGRGLLRPRLLAPLALLALLAATLLQPGPVQAQSTSDKAASSDKRSEIPFRKEATPGVDCTRWALGVGLATLAGVGVLWWLRRRHPAALQGLWHRPGPVRPRGASSSLNRCASRRAARCCWSKLTAAAC